MASDPEYSLGEITRSLQRMESRMDRIVEDHETRLRRVERWTYAVPPTVLVSAAAVIIAVVRGGP